MRIHILLATASVAILTGLAFAQDPKLVAKGQSLSVKNKCSMCHLVGGKGGKIGLALDGVSERRDAAAMRRILTDPLKEFPDAKIKMPKIDWAAGDVDAVIAYLQTLKATPAK
jgi:nitric oxide reductase subunit C